MATTDLVAVLRSYVERALSSVRGAKVLILDAATTRSVSLALSQTDILGHEVYLTERIEGDRGEQLFHLKVIERRDGGASRALCFCLVATDRPQRDTRASVCRQCVGADSSQRGSQNTHALSPTVFSPSHKQAVCFLRPTRENVARIRRELRDPRFGEYHLCECGWFGEAESVCWMTGWRFNSPPPPLFLPLSLHQPPGRRPPARPGRSRHGRTRRLRHRSVWRFRARGAAPLCCAAPARCRTPPCPRGLGLCRRHRRPHPLHGRRRLRPAVPAPPLRGAPPARVGGGGAAGGRAGSSGRRRRARAL